MIEKIFVGLILGVVLVIVSFYFYRIWTGKTKGCSGSCGSCGSSIAYAKRNTDEKDSQSCCPEQKDADDSG